MLAKLSLLIVFLWKYVVHCHEEGRSYVLRNSTVASDKLCKPKKSLVVFGSANSSFVIRLYSPNMREKSKKEQLSLH